MNRYLKKHIVKDLPHKIVLLIDLGQCGKTTLPKQLSQDFDYFN